MGLAVVAIAVGTVGAAQSRPDGVNVESRVDASNRGTVVVTNLRSVPLTAYLLEEIVEPCAPMQPRSSLRAVDAVVSEGGQPLLQFASRTETLGSSPCNKVGASTPARAELRAVIFQDGASSGDQASVAALLDNRRLALEECDTILSQLKAPDTASRTSEALNTELHARVAAAREKRAVPFPPLIDLAAVASVELDRTPGPRASQIARAIDAVERQRDKLLQSKPSLR
jgi:hypothetical protein